MGSLSPGIICFPSAAYHVAAAAILSVHFASPEAS